MFVLVYFGYKQYRIFCIECLTATLVDYIWKLCKQDMEKLLITREDMHIKEVSNIKVKIQKISQQIDELDQQIKAEEEKKKKELEETKQVRIGTQFSIQTNRNYYLRNLQKTQKEVRKKQNKQRNPARKRSRFPRILLKQKN